MNKDQIPKDNNNQNLNNNIIKESLKNNSSENPTMGDFERICTNCGAQVFVGDYCCHKCGVEYEQE